jgi:glycosyltransferase involved in cell wall biosynthesis
MKVKHENIKVSVVILAYNHEKYIRDAIESVLSQRLDYIFEIIIGDDHSTDNTSQIINDYLDKYPNLITHIKQSVNLGTTKNISTCFRICQGEYIVAFAGDDYWIDDGKLSKQINWLDNNIDYIGVGHLIETIDDNKNPKSINPSKSLWGKEVTIKEFLHGSFYPFSGLLFRNIFTDINSENYYNLLIQNRLVEDFTMCILLLSLGKIHVLEEVMSIYRFRNFSIDSNETNYNSTRDLQHKFLDHIEVYNALRIYFMNTYDFSYIYKLKSLEYIYQEKSKSLLNRIVYTLRYIPIKSKILLIYALFLKLPNFIFKKFK